MMTTSSSKARGGSMGGHLGAVTRGFRHLQGMANHSSGGVKIAGKQGGQGTHNEKACLGLWWHLPCCLPALLAQAQPFPLPSSNAQESVPKTGLGLVQDFSLLIPVR